MKLKNVILLVITLSLLAACTEDSKKETATKEVTKEKNQKEQKAVVEKSPDTDDSVSNSEIELQTKNVSQNETVIKRTAFFDTRMDPVYSSLRPKIQKFEINATETKEVICKNGTEILIPGNSFIDGQGNPVTGNIEIEVFEVNKLTDFITCNLQTVSNDQVIESAGMIYVDAKSNGKSLRLAENKSISISMPKMKAGNGYQIFEGIPEDEGTINWLVDESAEKDYLISIPSEILKYEYGLVYTHDKILYGLLDTLKFNPNDEKYVNTIIQTEEFANRIWMLERGTKMISSLLNKDMFCNPFTISIIDKSNTSKNIIDNNQYDYQLYELYFDNPEINIEVLDSLANKIVQDFIRSKAFTDWNNLKRDSINCDFTYWEWDFDVENSKNYYNFNMDGSKGNVPVFQDFGIDLLNQNAFELLISKGVSSNEALKMISYEKEKRNKIEKLKRRNKWRKEQQENWETRQNLKVFVEQTFFSTSNLGWINCDRFISDPEAGKAEMIVSIESKGEINYVDCSLIIPELNVKLSAFPHEEYSYTFTKKGGIYTNLPIGKEAYIIAVSYENGVCHYSSKKITIADGLNISLDMEILPKEELKDRLEDIL